MSKCTIIAKQLCSRLLNGVQGRSPCKKDDVILRARPQNDIVIYEGGCAPFTPA